MIKCDHDKVLVSGTRSEFCGEFVTLVASLLKEEIFDFDTIKLMVELARADHEGEGDDYIIKLGIDIVTAMKRHSLTLALKEHNHKREQEQQEKEEDNDPVTESMLHQLFGEMFESGNLK